MKIVYALLAAGALASFAIIYWWIDDMGLLLGLIDATIAVMVFVHQELQGGRFAYAQGYHAGYHAGADIECFGPDCELLEMARQRIAEINAMASVAGAFDRFPEAVR